MTTSTAVGSTAPTLPAWRPPLLSALLGGLLMAGAATGPAYMWPGVVLAQLLLLASWHRALGAADASAGMVVGATLLVALDVAVAIDDGAVSYGPVAVVLGVGYLLAVGQQLLRRDDRSGLTLSLSATVSLAALGALGVGWAIIPRVPDGDALALLAATAVTAAAVGRLAPRVTGALVGPLLAGTAAGGVVGANLTDADVVLGVGIGVAAAIPSALAAVGQVRLPARTAGWPAGAAWPVLTAAPLTYVVIRLAGF